MEYTTLLKTQKVLIIGASHLSFNEYLRINILSIYAVRGILFFSFVIPNILQLI